MVAQLCLWLWSLGDARKGGRPAARPPRRARLGLEALETREVPSVTNTGGALLVLEQYGSNTVTLANAYNGWFTVTENGSTSWFAPGSFGGQIVVNLGNTPGNTNTLNVVSTPAGVTTSIVEFYGWNFVSIGEGNPPAGVPQSKGNLDYLGGNVTVTGYSQYGGWNQLNIDDSNNQAQAYYTLTSDQNGPLFYRWEAGRGYFNVHYTDQADFNLDGGHSNYTWYYVYSTAAWQETSVFLNGQGGHGVVVGNGSLAGIYGSLNFLGGNHNTDYTINDSQDYYPHTAYYYSDGRGDHVLSGLTGGGGNITWNDASVYSLDIYTGSNTVRNGF
jgi:hypothetical protein